MIVLINTIWAIAVAAAGIGSVASIWLTDWRWAATGLVVTVILLWIGAAINAHSARGGRS